MRVVVAVAAAVAIGWPTGARADDAPAVDPAIRPEIEPAEPRTTDHLHQFGLSARFAFRMRGIATYDDVDFCGERSPDTGTGNAAVCIGRAPLSLDVEAAYGFARRKEVLLELRLGLERDFGSVVGDTGPRIHLLAPGVRFFFSEARTTKLFTTVQLVLDFSGYDDAAGKSRGLDYGARNLSGLWFDLHHAYGLYLFIGETLTFNRWLAGELEAGIGIQGRYP